MELLDVQRAMAAQGDFFFAKVMLNNGEEIPRPVLVVGSLGNDPRDIIVCSCTTSPVRSSFDVGVQLKKYTHIRTNKIYTIHRDNLLFKIDKAWIPKEFETIIWKSLEAICPQISPYRS